MSGFEVVGVVLASLPIVVAVQQSYANSITTWRKYHRKAKMLMRTLETDHTRLENILEMLLIGNAPDDQMEEMVKDPFGPLWKDPIIHSKVRGWLWKSHGVFEQNIQDLKEAVEEIQEKLKIERDDKVRYLIESI
uniref:Uncharacterized protein n=2 Tax=Podospora anserina (strain S / ATCC MYA-4624 / DSM 980 / FGSC 10383) TaxID=515849 RepID=A0A090CRT1_PODAN|nr:Putative protein of unknown function [Podospora anserina S mat+]